MRTLLYLVNFYGTPPLSFLKRYLEESHVARVWVIKLPAVRLTRGRLYMDALLVDDCGAEFRKEINFFFPLPYFAVALSVYLINFFYLLYFLRLCSVKSFDVCIGDVNFNGFLSYLLKLFGKTRYAVFMNGDVLPNPSVRGSLYYSPSVGKVSFLSVYLENILIKIQWAIRKIAYRCDLIWYPTDLIKEWDRLYDISPKNYFTTSCGVVDRFEVEKNADKEKNLLRVCYIGQLNEFAGIDMALRVLTRVKIAIPNIKLIVIGGGSLSIESYKNKAIELGVLENVEFLGYIPSMGDAVNVMSDCALGLAIFKPSPNNVSLYTEPTKVKDYLSAGIPIVITEDGPNVKYEIDRFSAGLLVRYEELEISREITRVLLDKNAYTKLIAGVKKMGIFFDYRERFSLFWRKVLGNLYHDEVST